MESLRLRRRIETPDGTCAFNIHSTIEPRDHKSAALIIVLSAPPLIYTNYILQIFGVIVMFMPPQTADNKLSWKTFIKMIDTRSFKRLTYHCDVKVINVQNDDINTTVRSSCVIC